MANQHKDPISDEETNTRKRVGKACDRCRLKKSKCDGSNPCTRCQSDDSICVFGERKKSHDKVYPKGYVEMLEGQQEKLVNALRELYVRNLNHKGWPGPALQTSSKGFPLTHDILERLGLLRLDDHGDCEAFEDDPEKLRRRMMIKDEEHAFPTPSTTQSEFSPIHTPSTDSFPSRLFTKDKVPPVHFQPTPIHSPEEEVTTSFSDGPLGTDTAMCMDSAPLQIPQQTWMQSTANYVGAMDFLPYDVTGSYSSMGGMEQKANPCLPMAWMDDELGPMGLHTALT